MAFSSKRGRPRRALTHPAQDKGTQELRRHRAAQRTLEPLDALLHRGALSEREHRAALHFRWLYTLCYGTPNPSSILLTPLSESVARQDDPLWREAREGEYKHAASRLQGARLLRTVQNCCLYHEMPSDAQALVRLKEGLGLLNELWRTQKPRPTTTGQYFSSTEE